MLNLHFHRLFPGLSNKFLTSIDKALQVKQAS
jgi:hypothetical protein